MQKKINLSIQMPHDNKSYVPMHSDIYAGESLLRIRLDTINGCKKIYCTQCLLLIHTKSDFVIIRFKTP